MLLDEISLISSSLNCRSILCLGKGTNNWLKHRIDLKQQHHRDITPCSFYVSMWTGSLFGERVQKSQEEGREKVRACRQTFGTIVPQHPLCIRSSCKLLLARTLTVDTFDLHRFLVGGYLIQIIAGKRVFLSLTWRLLALNWCTLLVAMNPLASDGKSPRPETITAENQYACHNLSIWNKWQKSHFLN